jgi:hypothetical protein
MGDLAHSHSIVLLQLHISLSGICLAIIARTICSLFYTTNGNVDSKTLPPNELLWRPPILVGHTVAVVDVINLLDEHKYWKTMSAPHTENLRYNKRR